MIYHIHICIQIDLFALHIFGNARLFYDIRFQVDLCMIILSDHYEVSVVTFCGCQIFLSVNFSVRLCISKTTQPIPTKIKHDCTFRQCEKRAFKFHSKYLTMTMLVISSIKINDNVR